MSDPHAGPGTDRQALREEIATSTRILGRHDMIGMFGHISLLTDDPAGRYLLCPGAGARKDLVRPEDILELSFEDEFKPGIPLELYMHAQMHKAHPEVKSLIHVHSPNLTALAAMEVPPTELLMIHAAFWPTEIPLWDRPELITSHAMAAEFVELMGTSPIALLRWHGAVIIGATVREAIVRTLLAEYHAGIVLAALATERPLTPVPASRPELYARVMSPNTQDMYWRYEASYVGLAETPGVGH